MTASRVERHDRPIETTVVEGKSVRTRLPRMVHTQHVLWLTAGKLHLATYDCVSSKATATPVQSACLPRCTRNGSLCSQVAPHALKLAHCPSRPVVRKYFGTYFKNCSEANSITVVVTLLRGVNSHNASGGQLPSSHIDDTSEIPCLTVILKVVGLTPRTIKTF